MIVRNEIRNEGHTLTEMSLVLLIIVILASISFSMTFEMRNMRLVDQASVEALAILRSAQQKAIAKGTQVRLDFVSNLPGSQHGFKIYIGTSTSSDEEIPLSEGMKFSTTDLNKRIIFDGLGAPKAGTTLRTLVAAPNPYYFMIQSWDNQEQQRITIQSATGKSAIE